MPDLNGILSDKEIFDYRELLQGDPSEYDLDELPKDALRILDSLEASKKRNEELEREVDRLHVSPPYCTCDENPDGWKRCHGVLSDQRVEELTRERDKAEAHIEAVKLAAIREDPFVSGTVYICGICGGSGPARDQILHSSSCWLAEALNLKRRHAGWTPD